MSHIPLAVMMIPLILLRNEIDLKIQLSLKVFAIFEYHIILCHFCAYHLELKKNRTIETYELLLVLCNVPLSRFSALASER